MKKRLVGAIVLASVPAFAMAEGFSGEAGVSFIGDGSDSQAVAAYNYIGYDVDISSTITISPELLLGTGLSGGDVDGAGRFDIDNFVGVGVKGDYALSDLVSLYARANYVTIEYENSPVAANPQTFEDNVLALGVGFELGIFNMGYTQYSNDDTAGEDFVAVNFGFSYSF